MIVIHLGQSSCRCDTNNVLSPDSFALFDHLFVGDRLSIILINSVVNCGDDPSGILNPEKTFIHGFLGLINFLKAGDKHSAVIFNIYTVILLLVTILKPRTVKGTSLQTL